jgi:FHA domain
MAVLKSTTGEFRVPCRALVGRSSLADVVLSGRRASSEHAWIGWTAGRWTMRDLGSSNGTTINGRPLLTRDRATLTPGSKLCFGGDEETWVLVDAAPPEPAAVLLGPQRYSWGQQSLLVLGPLGGAEDDPEASVFLADDAWCVDDGASVLAHECGDIIRLASGYWRLLLPETNNNADAMTAGCELDLSQMELSFRVDSNQLQSVTLSQGPNSVQLQARAYLNTLWELAKFRAGSDDGWVSAIDLACKLRCSPEKVNVDIHRLRKLFQETGVHQAAQIVERDSAKRIRIGVPRIKSYAL